MKKLTTSDRLKQIMNERGLKQVDILEACKPYCEKYGVKLAKNDLSQYISGKVQPGQDKLTILGMALNVNEVWLMGYNVPSGKDELQSIEVVQNIIPLPTTRKVPLVGAIACGEPILAAENIEGEIDMPDNIRADFALRCKGDSMINARIFDGDIVYIRKQESVENGEIAAVLIGDEATLKRVRLYDDHISLEPDNPMYKPLVYWAEEMNSVKIIGRAVAFTSIVR